MKKKVMLSGAFVISLLPMLLNQYGGCKGVQEVSGLIHLFNPIGICSAALFIIGVWIPFRRKRVNTILGAVGVIGIVVSEIYTFLTWYTQTITGEMSLHNSFRFAFPEFYLGLAVSLMMAAAYPLLSKALPD